MRIALGGYTHETNTFGTIKVTEETVNAVKKCQQQLIRSATGVHSVDGGIIDEAQALGIELVPAMAAHLVPSGPTLRPVFEAFRDDLVEQMWQAHCQCPLDGIALDLHGAGVTEGYDDLEGEMLRAFRARFGDEMPIGIVLDLHGNITPEMIDRADVTVGYKCYPHVDGYDTARLMMKLLHQRILRGKPFGKALVKLPWMIPPAYGLTMAGAGHDVQQRLYAMPKEEPRLLDATFFHGFCYADVPFAGVSVVTTAEDQQTADRCARELARYAWSLRERFAVPTNSAKEAMDLAEKAEYPVVVNESSDNPGGGAPGDGTHLLREMLERDIPGSVYGFIYDPEVVDQAIAAGVGGRISCLLGAKNDGRHGTPIALKDAYVKTVSDGRFIKKNPMGAGGLTDLGPTVLLETGNVRIIVSYGRSQTLDDGPFRIVGVDWQDMRILALKSSQHFKGWWVGRAKTIISCDSPGIHSADLSSFDYQNIRKDQYPFTDVQWQ